jgi:hypothetical protein
VPQTAPRSSRALAVLRLAAWLGASTSPGSLAGNPDPSGETFFRQQVEPVLREHCLPCHSHAGGKMKGGLTLDSRSGWNTGGDHGPVVIPGNPDSSRLIQAIRRTHSHPGPAMPPDQPLPPEQVGLLVEWVRRGAPDPRIPSSPNPSRSPESWALRPLLKPTLPPHDSTHPIDALILSKAHARKPAPLADRRTLLRRLSLDLHGLLPTPEEVAEFQQDTAPDAVERWIDRLLASPRYGERWARHWLDVVHFAETHGHDQDRPRESAWRYREYVINALNQDRPYDRFVQEQIAADALFPDEPERIPALGFLAAGPWDESSLRDIREDTLDREIGRYIDRDDIVANVMSTFTSVTAHCARCHDHKFDPIGQQDYYALQAVFAGTEKAERLYDPDPALHRKRQFWTRIQVALDRRDLGLVESLLTPQLRDDMNAWAASAAQRTVTWVPLCDGLHAEAKHGSLVPQPDGSLLATGPSPATNTTTLTASLPPGTVSALRLELIPDDSLPARGPGRAPNGNLHLTDVRAFLLPPERSANAAAAETQPQPIPLANPSADFNQEGWDIAKAIDSDAGTGWGIHPQEGKAHVAVFELATPRAFPPGSSLRLVLEQQHGREHTLGRFRVSLTGDAPPIRADSLPAPLLAALAVAPDRRTPEQQSIVTTHYLATRATTELARLPEPKRVFAGASLFPANGGQKSTARPRPVRVLRRGEVSRPIEVAAPGALSCVTALSPRFETVAPVWDPSRPDLPEEAGRRAALARWLSHRDNPLVWRSIVNRVWQHHFGRGLVETPNDFGRMGGTPVAPELLDWLAVTFRDDLGGSFKALHRLILTSRAWQQSAASPETATALEPTRRRLDAESFRDSVLRFSGQLDDTLGGPSIKQFAMSPGIHVTPNVNYAAFDPDAPGSRRRSIYRFLFRTLPDPLMDTLDSPAGDQSAPVRSESFTALQAFALLNHPFVIRQSEHLATRISGECGDPQGQVRRLCQIVWQRDPTPDEQERFALHARSHGLPHLGRVLLNSNELHFLD